MSNVPEISIIVPVYKVEEYLSQCIDSILVQTFTNFELLLVDDGSPDRCGEMCEEYAQKDERIRVFHQENAGVSTARNKGLAEAYGKYIVFVDSDDYILPAYLEDLYNELSEHKGSGVVIESVIKLYPNGVMQPSVFPNLDFSSEDRFRVLTDLVDKNIGGAVGEMVADLERAGKRHAVITGVVEGGDPAVQAEINDWCKAAQVRRRFRDTNLAQIGRPYPGMMDLYIDETNLYNRMWLYTKQFDWEKMWAIADNITDEDAIRAKAQDILDTFDIEGGGTVEKVWDMARYVVAFEQWVRDEKIAFVASHYDGFAKGVAGKLDSMLIPAFSMLIKQGTACAVEGDIKVAMAMSILKTIAGCGQLSEMYSIDFNEDICIIGHSGSGDADISTARKPTMKIVPVFHGKTGGGYLTQFYPPVGDVTYLAITQDKDGHFKFVVAEGVNEPGPIFTFGDTNMRTRFSCGAREFVNRWSEAGPTHHMAAATGHHIDTILKVAEIFNVPVDVITR